MRIYVGNLPYEVTDQELQSLFGQKGEVSEVIIPMDRDTGRPKGFAFVEMPNREEALQAIADLHNHTLNSRTINVNEARPKPERSGGFGGGGGGGRGGFGRGGGGGGGGGRGGGRGDRGWDRR